MVVKYPCKNKREAERRENEIMKELKANMNAIKIFLTEEERKEYNKVYNKEYRETNKEKIQEYKEDNREKIREYFKQKITCQCGCNVLKYNLKQHERTKKHSDLINPIQ